jgi:hypothetical protein
MSGASPGMCCTWWVDPMTSELAALKAVDFDWTRHLDSVWANSSSKTSELNGALADELVDHATSAMRPAGLSPLGRVVIGAAGSGKTHLMGELRRRIWENGGWFVLLDLADVNDFWSTASLSLLQSLQRTFRGGLTQGDQILLRLCSTVAMEPVLKKQYASIVNARGEEIAKLADAVVNALRRDHRSETQQFRSIIKAFVLFQSPDPQMSDCAYSWLQGVDIEGNTFGPTTNPRDVIRGLSWLMSLTGPTLLVVDQIDAIVSVHNHALAATADVDDEQSHKALQIIDELAGGLMEMRDVTRRTTTLLSSLEATWEVLKNRAIATARDRFHDPDYLRPLANGKTAEAIIMDRLQDAYSARNFTPPYPSWPFRPGAFDETVGWLPRQLLKRCDAHRRKCVANGGVAELDSFDVKATADRQAAPPPAINSRLR